MYYVDIISSIIRRKELLKLSSSLSTPDKFLIKFTKLNINLKLYKSHQKENG